MNTFITNNNKTNFMSKLKNAGVLTGTLLSLFTTQINTYAATLNDYTLTDTNRYSSNFDLISIFGFFAFFLIILAICLIFWIFFSIVLWFMFKKMGEPGWKAFIPFYNQYVLFEKVMGEGFLFLIPCIAPAIPYVGWIISFLFNLIFSIRIAKCFGKNIIFGILTAFFGIICYPILAFSSDKYRELPKWDINNPFVDFN